jgi:hypothetical protein
MVLLSPALGIFSNSLVQILPVLSVLFVFSWVFAGKEA